MKEIQLTKGHVALVDDDVFENLNQWKWASSKHRSTFYAQRTDYTNGKKSIKMHRVILGLTDPNILTDHIDGNGLNNQRNNIRIATNSQNIANTNSYRKSLSKYKGVYRTKQGNKWMAQLRKNGVLHHFGTFKTEEDAAREYDKHAIVIHGEFANLNFKNV